jgi:hypothetical protein
MSQLLREILEDMEDGVLVHVTKECTHCGRITEDPVAVERYVFDEAMDVDPDVNFIEDDKHMSRITYTCQACDDGVFADDDVNDDDELDFVVDVDDDY